VILIEKSLIVCDQRIDVTGRAVLTGWIEIFRRAGGGRLAAAGRTSLGKRGFLSLASGPGDA
jgi:hypothetical protein